MNEPSETPSQQAPSASTSTSESTSSVASLPKRRGRPPGSKNRPKLLETAESKIESALVPKEEKKLLPEDPAEFDKAISPLRPMVRPLMHGISRLCKTAGVDPLDKEEIDSGTIAFSALMYQYGAMLDARVLVALWVAGVTIPRAVQFAEDRSRKARDAALRVQAPQPLPLSETPSKVEGPP